MVPYRCSSRCIERIATQWPDIDGNKTDEEMLLEASITKGGAASARQRAEDEWSEEEKKACFTQTPHIS